MAALHPQNAEYYEKLSGLRFTSFETPDPTRKYVPKATNEFSSPYGPLPIPPIAPASIFEFCFPPDDPLPPVDYPLFVNSASTQQLTVHEFYKRVESLARALKVEGPNPLGLGPSPRTVNQQGEVVAVISKNTIDWPVVAHACFMTGLVFGGISPSSTDSEMRMMLKKMRCTAAIVHEDLMSNLERVLQDETRNLYLDPEKIVILTEDQTKLRFRRYWTVEGLVRLGAPLTFNPRGDRGGSDICFLFQSSGTSGLPKAMIITHENAVAIGQQSMIDSVMIRRFLKIPAYHQVLLAVVPCYHSYGMAHWIIRLNLSQATNVFLPKWSLEAALRAISTYRITTLPIVPYLAQKMAQADLGAHDLSSVKNAYSGGSYLSPSVASALGSKLPQKSPLSSGYAMSEALSIARPVLPGMFGLPPSKPNASTVGHLLAGMTARIVDPITGLDVGRNDAGELWVRGRNCSPGYFDDVNATAGLYCDGWLQTGDICRRDEMDRITFVERMKELIKVKGMQVAPVEIENCLLEHPENWVQDACVSEVSLRDGITTPRAWVVLSEAGRAESEEVVLMDLIRFVKETLAPYKHLNGGIQIIDEIPRTPTGKMLRKNLRAAYELAAAKAKL